MNRQILRVPGALALAFCLAASALPADARSVPSRPHSSGGSSASGGGGGHASAPSAQGARRVPTRTHGEAHAGGGHPGGGYPGWGYPPYYWDGYYGSWWSLGVLWGWPGYWGDGWWYGYPAGWYPAPYSYYGAGESQGPAFVETSVRPKRAQVILDGEPIGEAREFNGTWDVLELEPGRHVFSFAAPGYMSLEVGIAAATGRRYRIAYDLREGEGRDPRSDALLRPAAPPPAAPPDGAAAPPPAQERTTERGEPGLRRGFLKIQVSPSDAAVYLDGEFLGRGDELARLHGAIPVAAGGHRIEVVRPGYRSRAENVDVGDGQQPAEVRIDLERERGSAL